ncbi:MAG: ROK family protein [Mycobacteriales bacterium]
MATAAKPPARTPARPSTPARTLALDIGGTGLKAAVLDPRGELLSSRLRVPTRYPCPPDVLVTTLTDLVAPLAPYERVSVGFPGVVRGGRILTAPHFVTLAGPGSKTSPRLATAWSGFDLAEALARALDHPVKVANDADLQGAAVISGEGLELVLTLGTGLGSALFHRGRLTCHLELAHHPFQKGQTYNDRIGDAARKRVGTKKWVARVEVAVQTIRDLLCPDHIYLGGGNAVRLGSGAGLGPGVSVVDNSAGLLGGIALWERHVLDGWE